MNRLLAALLLVSSTSFAAEPDGVDKLLSDFFADFSARKIERLSSDFFHPGAQAVFGEHVTVLSSPEEVRGMFTAILGGLDKRGYHRSVIRHVSKTRVGEHYVLATVLFDRVMVDGKKIDTVCSTYSMVKSKSGWRFLTWIPTDPLPNGRCA